MQTHVSLHPFIQSNNIYITKCNQPASTITKQTSKALDGSIHDVSDMAREVLPSEWANLYVITLSLYQQLFNTEYMESTGTMNMGRATVRFYLIR